MIKVIYQKLKIYNYISLLLLLFIISTIYQWHIINQAIPIWDGAAFMYTAQTSALDFGNGILSGLKSIYINRGWRPIIFPAFATPFYIISGGSIRYSILLMQGFSYFIIGIYLYKIFLISLSKPRALIGTFLLLSTTWLINYAYLFYSELLWMVFFTVTIYYLLASNLNNNSRSYITAGIFYGLMICVRPVETLILSAFPILVKTLSDLYYKNIPLFDVFLIALFNLVIGLNFALKIGHIYSFIVITIFLFISLKKIENKFYKLLVISEYVSFLWFLPFLNELYLWVYETSFGQLVQLGNTSLRGASITTILNQLLDSYNYNVFITILILSFIVSLTDKISLFIKIFFYISLSILPMLVAYSVTGAIDYRRIMPSIYAFYILFITFSLYSSKRFLNINLIIVLLMIIIQFTSIITNFSQFPTSFYNFNLIRFISVKPKPPSFNTDPNFQLLSLFNKNNLSNTRTAAYTYCYRDYLQCEKSNIPIFEPEALTTASYENKTFNYVNISRDLDLTDVLNISKQLKERGYNYLLLDSYPGSRALNFEDPYNDHIRFFQKYVPITKNQFELIDCSDILKRNICIYRIL